jgi:hypothetical protein
MMSNLFLLIWVIIGALGGVFCAWVIGGPKLLASFKPKEIKSAARLFIVCALGGIGGILAGLLIGYIGAQVQGSDKTTAGAITGAILGLFVMPFGTYGLFHFLESHLAESSKESGAGKMLMKSAGCIIVGLAPLVGLFAGAELGAAVGSDGFLLADALVPFVGGLAILIIPLMIWLTLNDESYGWPQAGPLRGSELSGRRRVGWDARQARRAGRRGNRW